jgi:hypothetical protein
MDFILGYCRYGLRRHPFLFRLSVLLFTLDLFMLGMNTYNGWTLLGVAGYILFFMCVLGEYLLNRQK